MAAKKKSKASKPPSNLTATEPSKDEGFGILSVDSNLPMTSYISVVGVHTTLLAFTAVFLPRTTFLGDLDSPVELTSRDKPQHPFLNALTDNPTSTLACLCIGSMFVQGWWGGWMRHWWVDATTTGTKEERKREKSILESGKLKVMAVACATTIVASFALHGVLVLFGAPITSFIFKTYLLALLVSVLVVFPPAYIFGAPLPGNETKAVVVRWTWVRLFAEFSTRNAVERAVVYPVIGTMVGCWTGVIPIALDWDRPWQAWPLTPAFGALGGYILASITALTVNAIKYLEHQRMLSPQANYQKTK